MKHGLYAVLCALMVTFSLFAEECGVYSWHLDYLYWRPCPDGFFVSMDQRQDELTFSDSSQAFMLPVDLFDASTKVSYVTPDGQSGFRLGVGYPLCDWNLSLHWTHFHPYYDKGITACDYFLIPYMNTEMTHFIFITSDIPNEETGNFDIYKDFQFRARRVKTNWKLNFNTVDITAAPSENPCDCWTLETQFSLRFLFLKQELSLKSTGKLQGVSVPTESEAQKVGLVTDLADIILREKIEHCFKGAGPRISLLLERDLFCGFSIFSEAGAAFSVGETESKTHVKAERFNSPFPQADSNEFLIEHSCSKYCLRPHIDLHLGLQWEQYFCGTSWRRALFKLGWEHHYFFNQGLVHWDPESEHYLAHENGSLSMQGLTLSARVEF